MSEPLTADWISQHDTTSDPVPNSSFSLSTSSSSSSTTDRWKHHSLPRTSVAERRQQAHAERAHQLQDLERQITDAATWSKRRTDMLTTSSQQHNTMDDSLLVLNDDNDDNDTKSNTTTSSPTTSRKMIDLRDATLEDLEGLIAASARRLANYRLQKTTEVSAATTTSSKRSSMDSMDAEIRSPGTTSSKKSSIHSNNMRLSYLLGSSGNTGDYGDEEDINARSFADDHTVTMADFAPQPSTTTPSTKRTAMASASYNSIRNKFESAATTTTTPQERILQFDPLLSTKTNGDTSAGKGKQSITTSTNLTSSAQSNLRSIAEAKDKERRRTTRPRPGELDMNEIKRSSSTLMESPLTPTRLPTPRTNHVSTSTAFSPRLSSPARSNSHRIRTLSTVDRKENDALSWLRNDKDKMKSAATNDKRFIKPTTSLSVSTSNRTRRSLPATKKSIGMENDRDDSVDADVEDQPKIRPIRNRTISMTSMVGNTGRMHRDIAKKNMRVLADFDPLLVDDKKKTTHQRRQQQHLLDDDNDTWDEADEEESSSTLRRRLHPRSRVVSMTTLERSSLSTSTRKTTTTTKTTQHKSSNNGVLMPQESKSMSVQPASRRKRGKTLPSNSASPPAMAPLALPPMKMDSLGGVVSDETITSVKRSTRSAKTPTRIPLLISRSSRQSLRAVDNYSEDELLHSSESEKDRITTKQKKVKSDTNGQVTAGAKIGPTTTVYSGSMIVSNSSGTRLGRSSDKPTQSTSIRTTGRRGKTLSSLAPSESTIMNNTTRQRKVSTLSTSASASHVTKASSSSHGAHGLISPPESIKGNHPTTSHTTGYHTLPSRRKPTLLHEQLQGLVDDSTQHTSTAWSSLVEQEKKLKHVPVLRGGSASTSTKDSVPDKTTGIRAPMSSQAALKLYDSCLSSYEKKEILDYSQVYFVGNHAQKRLATKEHTTCNHGYDDDRGDYHIVLRDHLAYRYEVLEVLGKGSFGQVLKCFDHQKGQMTAVKIIRNKKRFHAQALVEVKILEDLIKWDPEDKHNNVRMLDHFYFRSHLCIAFECLSINLYDFIKSNNFQGFSMGLIRRFTIQLLNSLVLLRKHKLIHCDLKPENILLKHPTKSSIKVIDFGSSCLENEKVYTYIQSRFYRSPEVIMGMEYSMAIDMWSVGCILAELYTGYPLFPGENEHEQFACIMEIQGVPDKHLIEKATRRKVFFDSNGLPRIRSNSKGRKRRPGTKPLSYALKSSDDNFIDFVNLCLQWDPEQRLTPEDAFKHVWIAGSSKRRQL